MTTTTNTRQAQWQKLFNHILGYQALWIADIGLKARLFRTIADAGEAGIGEDELARTLDYAPRYVQTWCRAAYAYELIDWDAAGGYRLPDDVGALLLDPRDPLYMGGRLQLYAAIHEDFRAFPAHLASGATWPRGEHDHGLLEAIAASTRPDAVALTDEVLPQAPLTLGVLESGGRILDVGAGGGHHVVHYAQRFPCSEVVGLEADAASVALARRALSQAGIDGRARVLHADANELDEEDAYDLVTMNIALHETGGPQQYRNVLRRVRRALKPGATVLVSELPYPDSPRAYRDEPVYKSLAGVQFHEALVGCGMITRNELRELLLAAGFTRVREAKQPLPARFVMLAER